MQLIELSPMDVAMFVYLYWCAWHVHACMFLCMQGVGMLMHLSVCVFACASADGPLFLWPLVFLLPRAPPLSSLPPVILFYGASSVVKLPRVTQQLQSSFSGTSPPVVLALTSLLM